MLTAILAFVVVFLVGAVLMAAVELFGIGIGALVARLFRR